jgi:hypothetical protein
MISIIFPVSTFAGSISGTVTGSLDSQPLEGIYISVYDDSFSNQLGSAQTQSDGTYLVSGMDSGSYLVRAISTGAIYAEEFYENANHKNAATTVNVSSGQTTAGINFNLELSGSISGLITDAGTEQPIENLTVFAYDYSSVEFVRTNRTLSDGSYSIIGLPPGNYRVKVGGVGTSYPQKYFDNTHSWNAAASVALEQGQPITGININLCKAGNISGVVTDSSNGQPIEGITICARDDSIGFNGCGTQTQSDGSYQFTNLPAGEFKVSGYDPENSYARKYYNGSYSPDSATSVVVISNQTTANINMALEKGGAIVGSIFDNNSQPIADVWVLVYADPCWENFVANDKTDSKGNFNLSPIPAGGVYIYAQANYYEQRYIVNEWWDGSDGELDCKNATAFNVTPGQTSSGVNFSLEFGGSISGSVTGGNGQNLGDVWIIAYANQCSQNWVGSGKTDSNGNYTIYGLPVGSIYIIADANYEIPRDYIDLWWDGSAVSNACNSAMPLTIVAEQNIPDVDFILKKASVTTMPWIPLLLLNTQ